MRRILAAAATATLLGSGAVLAQAAAEDTAAVHGMGTMEGQIMEMQESVNAEFARIGITADAGDLTLTQLSEVLLVLNDDSLEGQDQADQINLIIEE
jgi:hypothetical protein